MTLTQAVYSRIQDETHAKRPHYERYSLLAVPPTLEQLVGVETPGGLADELGLSAKGRVVFFIVDGLGYLKLLHLLKEGELSFGPRTSEATLIPLTSVFPPTTTTALTTLATGVSPAAHGVLGYSVFLQDPGAVVNMIHLSPPGAQSGALAKLGISPAGMLPVQTTYQRLATHKVPTSLFLPKRIADSGLSELLYQGVGDTTAFLTLSDLFMHLRGLLKKPGQRILSVYWPTTDSIAHQYGPHCSAFAAETRHFFRTLDEELLARVEDVTVLIAADHGFQPFNPAQDIVSCPDHPELRESLLFPPVGEARAASLFVRRGCEGRIREFLHERFPQEFEVLTTEQALDRKLWGEELPKPNIQARMGDLLVLSRGRKCLMWPREPVTMRGMHGGMTQEELLVPLLALNL
ncbi:MAG: alkaline phosphatase family protein [Candidatus Bipolaricaulota bacterium]